MEELIIDKEYSITTKEVVIDKIKLPYVEKVKFNRLGVKGKVSRLKYLKYLKGKELELVSIISQSRYLRLLKDNLGFHIRIEEDLEDKDLSSENLLIEYLKDKYTILIDEEINSGMSGDISRVEISKGFLI